VKHALVKQVQFSKEMNVKKLVFGFADFFLFSLSANEICCVPVTLFSNK
jgi:hypothetical protein